MPFVVPGEAFDLAYLDIERLALEAGPPPGCLCLVGTPGLRAVLICWPPGYGHRARRLRPHRAHHDDHTGLITMLEDMAAFRVADATTKEGPAV